MRRGRAGTCAAVVPGLVGVAQLGGAPERLLDHLGGRGLRHPQQRVQLGLLGVCGGHGRALVLS